MSVARLGTLLEIGPAHDVETTREILFHTHNNSIMSRGPRITIFPHNIRDNIVYYNQSHLNNVNFKVIVQNLCSSEFKRSLRPNAVLHRAWFISDAAQGQFLPSNNVRTISFRLESSWLVDLLRKQ